jgi:phosphatidylserine/phosphatidylglycerophosphate/cardiolipin synthase-like enzyme
MVSGTDAQTQLVITTPRRYGVDLAEYAGCRTTLGVLTELFVKAKNKVVVAAPFLQEGAGLSGGPLRSSLDAALKKGVDVDVVSTKRGLETLAAAYRQSRTPGRLRFFRPEGEDESRRRLGSHAKFCISDQTRAYIGSANLTGPGLNENLEIGVMISGDAALQLERFWQHALDIGLFVSFEE